MREAKQKCNALVQRALDEGPQVVTRRGEEVVVISARECRRLTRPVSDFAEFLLAAPDLSQLEIERVADPTWAVAEGSYR